jgi:MSHA biogenesis protein MshP
VLAVLGAALVTVSTLQHSSAALDLQGVRAYQAARAGVEWGLYRILNPDNIADIPVAGSDPTKAPSCWSPAATLTLGSTLSGFTTTVSCELLAAGDTTELDKTVRVYRIISTATSGTAGQPNYVSRQVEATVSRCKKPSNPPDYDC